MAEKVLYWGSGTGEVDKIYEPIAVSLNQPLTIIIYLTTCVHTRFYFLLYHHLNFFVRNSLLYLRSVNMLNTKVTRVNNRLIAVSPDQINRIMAEYPPKPYSYDYYDEKSPMDGVVNLHDK